MSLIEQCQERIRCPRCHEVGRVIDEATVSYDDNEVSGRGWCCNPSCAIIRHSFALDRGVLDGIQISAPEPLDFAFTWDIVNSRVRVTSDAGQLNYEIEDKCMCEDCRRKEQEELMALAREQDEQALYVVVSGDKETYHLLAVCSNKYLAETLAGKDPEGRVVRFETPVPTRDRPFPAFVVSVGVGDRYRIIDVTSDEKRAAKIATSVRGTVSCFDAMPSMGSSSSVRYYKFFVPLSDERNNEDDVYYVDRFSRREAGFVGVTPPPMVTRRRRYNNDLPYRFEVAATDQREAERVANDLRSGLDTGRFNENNFEYNVDYSMVLNDNGTWEVDPCLLVAADVD